MAREVEERHPGESWLVWKLGNLLTVDRDSMRSIGFAWLFKEGGRWCFRPRITGNVALFYNAVVFLRLSWPLGIFWALRWMATGKRAYWQAGVGFKLNGRFSITCRVQGDASAAAGVNGPNHGQATGLDYGTH